MPETFFRVRNFEKFQHYHDRRPPWIKLYRDLWDDPRFFAMTESDRYILIGIFMLASQHENKISTNQKWLKAKLLINRAIPLSMLIDTGWIESVMQDASDMLAECYPSRARGETETDIQNTETDIQRQIPAFGRFQNVLLSAVEYQELENRFNGSLDGKIEALSEYIASKGKKYKSHYATILSWDRKNTNEQRTRETKSEELIRKQREAGERTRELLRRTDGDAFGSSN